MLKRENMFWHWSNEIPPLVCDAVVGRGLILSQGTALVGDGEEGVVDEAVRKTKVGFFQGDADAWLYHILWGYMKKANENSGWKFKITHQQEPQFTVYDKDFFYDFHEDASFHEKDMRKLSLVVFLSEPTDYTGGGFEFREDNMEQIPTGKGSILAFPSFLYHRVAPVESGVRYSIVNWFTGPALI
jgi:PKHD-type hydroxylase